MNALATKKFMRTKGKTMKKICNMTAVIFFLLLHTTWAANMTVKMIEGYAEVRRGVSEEWKALAVGDILKPEDTIRTGENAEVKIQVAENDFFMLYSYSVLDIADIRQLTKNDLLLKLSMEHIRSVPNSKPNIKSPSTTIMHGENKATAAVKSSNTQKEISADIGTMRLEGARALFLQKYYSSAIISIKTTIRKFGLRDPFVALQLAAQSFERLGLIQHAIDEYIASSNTRLTEAEKKEAQQQLARLKQIPR